jgi:hypothetical protein
MKKILKKFYVYKPEKIGECTKLAKENCKNCYYRDSDWIDFKECLTRKELRFKWGEEKDKAQR